MWVVTSRLRTPYTFLCKLFEIIGPINNVEHSDTIIDTMRQVSPLEIIPIYFKYATEAVFHSFFKLIKRQYIFPSIKDIVSCVIPWIQHIRLLPSQLTCTPGIPNTFAYFTPYQFLENLIIICENISDSDFEYIASMWSELMKSPDHKQMVPLFISRWPNESVKQKLYSSLIDSHPYDMSRRLIINLGFSYYFHVTFNQKRNFDDELWICPLILNSIKNNWLELKENLPAMIHFSLLYREKVPSLFAMICSKLKVEYPDTKLEITHLKKTIQQFIYSLDMEQNMESNLDYNQEDSNSEPHLKKDLSGKQIKNDKTNLLVKWCDESLKWTFGSPNTMFCAISLYIFNKINEIKPNLLQIDKNFLIALMRITSFHLANNENNDNNSFLSLLVNETIEIFKQNYSKDPYLAYNFCTCFLDCRVFVYGDSLITALPIFKAAMNDPDLMPKISITAISIIRPTIPKLEHSHFCRYQLCEMIKVIKSDEMLMITVPLKNLNSSYFHELISSEKIVERSSVSALCKSLDNYAMMASTASISLLDCIFEIAAYVVEQVIDENNRVPLVKIYSKALTNISRCPNSIIFIKTISERQPGIISTGIIDVFEWDRMLDFVMNSLNQLLPKNSFTPSKITDVPNFKIVENFLFCDTPPKILPFDAECELISNISCLKQPQEWHQQKIENSLRLNKQNENKKLSSFIEQEITTPQSSPLNSSSYSYEESWGPLLHPIALILNSQLMKC